MPRCLWALHNDRPTIEIELSSLTGGNPLVRRLIADTGTGSATTVFELVLDEVDCVNTGGILMGHVQLGGAFSGSFPLYLVDVRVPQLNFDEPVPAVGVSQMPHGFNGIAGFRFLNGFHYGNFGDAQHFGLEAP